MVAIEMLVRTVPKSEISRILGEWFVGVKRRMFSRSKRLKFDKDRVRSFFQQRSKENNFVDFTESTTEWYLTGLDGMFLRTSVLSKKPTVIDFGCGRGGLLKKLRAFEKDFDYIGIDFDEVAVEECREKFENPNTKFLKGDASSIDLTGLKCIDAKKEDCTIVFLINFLPYIEDLDHFLSHLKKMGPTHVVIIDPYPSPFWEDVFGGFRIYIRKPKMISLRMEILGFQKIHSEQLSIFSFLNKPIFIINTTSIWKLNI